MALASGDLDATLIGESLDNAGMGRSLAASLSDIAVLAATMGENLAISAKVKHVLTAT